MVKVVFLIMSGDQKMDLALRMAAASVANRRFEDLKIIFFGPSQEKLLNLEGQAKEDFDYLLKNGAVDKNGQALPFRAGLYHYVGTIGLLIPAPLGFWCLGWCPQEGVFLPWMSRWVDYPPLPPPQERNH